MPDRVCADMFAAIADGATDSDAGGSGDESVVLTMRGRGEGSARGLDHDVRALPAGGGADCLGRILTELDIAAWQSPWILTPVGVLAKQKLALLV